MMLMLWSAPRSRSTAFYRMMTERGDFTAIHEPFSNVAIFGHTEIGDKPLATAPKPSPTCGSWRRTHNIPS
jgi:hypothetical protein